MTTPPFVNSTNPIFLKDTRTTPAYTPPFSSENEPTTEAVAKVQAPPSLKAANPTASVGLSAVNGSAATFMRSDAAPAISQSISPTWTGTHTFSSNIGVGASSPQVPIDIVGAAGPRFLLYGQSGSNGFQSGMGVDLGQTTSSMGFFIGPNASFTIDAGGGGSGATFPYSSYTTRFTIDPAGRVGLNKPNTIEAMLHIVQNTTSTVGLKIVKVPSGTADMVEVYDADGTTPFFLVSNVGHVKFASLPTSDPHDAGQIWNNSGVVNISAG